MLKLTTDKLEASRGLSATAELLVLLCDRYISLHGGKCGQALACHYGHFLHHFRLH